MNEDKIFIYAHGGCKEAGKKNPFGGWAIKLKWHEHTKTKSGHLQNVTPETMELYATMQSLKSLKDNKAEVEVFTDSLYVINTISGKGDIETNARGWAVFFRDLCRFENVTFSWVDSTKSADLKEVVELVNKEVAGL